VNMKGMNFELLGYIHCIFILY